VSVVTSGVARNFRQRYVNL